MKKIMLVSTAMIALASSIVSTAAENDAVKWSYTGDAGPAHWGELSSDWTSCSTGNSQSPIDVIFSDASSDQKIMTSYKNSSISVLNNGHTIQQNFEPGSQMKSGDKTYNLVQMHFHSPSEHTFNGEHFPLEVHLVHADNNGQLAVVGVMFEQGAKNEAVEKIWASMPKTANSTENSTQTINAAEVLPENMTFALYSGSLTTPPCSEGVRWHVVQKPLQASKEQIEKFQSVISENNRPIMPLNDREVKIVND